MKEILRNILRRKLRSFLTVFGISIGIFALTVMGSMSEYFNNLLSRSIRYSTDIVRVYPKSSVAGPGSGIMPVADADQFKKIPEVKDVAPAMFTTLDENANILSGSLAFGVPPEQSEVIFGKVGLGSGRYLKTDDKDQALLGFGLASKFGLKIGDKKKLRGHEFEIVGIAKPTQVDQLDNLAVVPLTTIQTMNKLPGFANAVILIPKKASQAQLIANKVKKDFPRFEALSPQDVVDQTKRSLLIFNVIILAGAFLAAVVGGFATLNTMVMSVSERTREIGIKKAIGASNGAVIREYLLESSFIGLIGGSLGVFFGFLGTVLINQTTKQLVSGLTIFSFTPRLAVLAILFAVILGSLAGFFPALNAARMNTVKALKSL